MVPCIVIVLIGVRSARASVRICDPFPKAHTPQASDDRLGIAAVADAGTLNPSPRVCAAGTQALQQRRLFDIVDLWKAANRTLNVTANCQHADAMQRPHAPAGFAGAP